MRKHAANQTQRSQKEDSQKEKNWSHATENIRPQEHQAANIGAFRSLVMRINP